MEVANADGGGSVCLGLWERCILLSPSLPLAEGAGVECAMVTAHLALSYDTVTSCTNPNFALVQPSHPYNHHAPCLVLHFWKCFLS